MAAYAPNGIISSFLLTTGAHVRNRSVTMTMGSVLEKPLTPLIALWCLCLRDYTH